MTIGTNIKKFREAKRISQNDLALLVGVGQSLVSNWESDTASPHADLLPKLANALEKRIEDFFIGIEYGHSTSENNDKKQAETDRMKNNYISLLEKDNNRLNDENTSVKNDNSQLKGENKTQKEDNGKLQEDNDKLTKENKAQKTEIKRLNN